MADKTKPVAIRDSVLSTLEEAEGKLTAAEKVAAELPQLRAQVKALRRAIDSMDTEATPRRSSGGQTIKELIKTALAELPGGQLTFVPNGMLPAVHKLVGGNRSSVQVEIHRLEKTNEIVIERTNEVKPKPIAIRLAKPALAAVQELKEG